MAGGDGYEQLSVREPALACIRPGAQSKTAPHDQRGTFTPSLLGVALKPGAGVSRPRNFSPMDLLRKLIEHLATDLRAEDGPPGPDVVVDLHAERVQEPPQTITGQRAFRSTSACGS